MPGSRMPARLERLDKEAKCTCCPGNTILLADPNLLSEKLGEELNHIDEDRIRIQAGYDFVNRILAGT